MTFDTKSFGLSTKVQKLDWVPKIEYMERIEKIQKLGLEAFQYSDVEDKLKRAFSEVERLPKEIGIPGVKYLEGRSHDLCQNLLVSKWNENLKVTIGFYNMELFGNIRKAILVKWREWNQNTVGSGENMGGSRRRSYTVFVEIYRKVSRRIGELLRSTLGLSEALLYCVIL